MKTIVLFIDLIFPTFAFADAETRKAVKEVQDQMQSPEFHKNAAKESKAAADVEAHVKQLSGSPENEADMYKFAAQILGNMQDKTPQEMQEILQQAQKDPEAFANSWTPEQKQQLKELSERIPAGQKRTP